MDNTEGVAHGGPYLRRAKAMDYLNLPSATFYRLVAAGQLPAPVKLGARVSLFSKPALDAAVQALVGKEDRS